MANVYAQFVKQQEPINQGGQQAPTQSGGANVYEQFVNPQQQGQSNAQTQPQVASPQDGQPSTTPTMEQQSLSQPPATGQTQQAQADSTGGVQPAQMAQYQQDDSLFDRAKDAYTGESKMTPEIQGLEEVGNAPEFLAHSFKALKALAGLSFTSDENKAMKSIKENMPDSSFSKDSKGNVIVTLPSGKYVLNKPGFTTTDLLRGSIDAGLFAGTGGEGNLAKAAAQSAIKSAGVELGKQEIEKAVGGGDVNLKDVALTGAIGAGGQLVGNVAGTVARALKGTPQKEAESLISQSEQAGIPITTSDVFPPKTKPTKFVKDIGESIPVVGTSGKREAQQEARQKAAEQFGEKYKPDYDEIKKSITGKAAKIKQAAIDSRQRAVEQVKDTPTQAPNTVESIDKEINRLTKLPSGQPRKNVNQSMVSTLENYKADVQSGADFKTLDDLRTTLREDMSPDFTKSGTRQEGAIKRIYGSMTKDMDDVVKGNLTLQEFRQWKRGNAVYGQEMQKLQKSRIKNILNVGDDLSPEQIDKSILNKDSVIRQRTYESLDSKGRDNARSAIVSHMFEKASQDGELSVNRLASQMNKNKDAIDTFFKGKERREIEGLSRVLERTRGAQDASVVTKSGQKAIPFIGALSAGLAPIATTLSVLGAGGLSRAYESKAFRNMLVRLAGTPKGSTAYESAISDISDYLTLSAQVYQKSNPQGQSQQQ